LTVNTVGSGSVTVDPVQAVYTTGQVVTLTPVPADNSWEFTGWSGDLTGSADPAALMMDGDKVVTATFVPVSLEWGSIDITRSGSDWVVELENSLIYVKYGFSQIKQGEPYDRIVEFVVKSRNTLVADKLDGRQSNSPTIYTITNATVTFDGPDRKTVRITFGNNQRVTNVTMFRGSPVLQLDYQSGGHNLDYGIVGNTWKIYGAEAWQALNGWPITYPTLQDNITFSGSYYRDQWGDPGPLSYNGSMIMGLYNSSTGFGAGLVLSFADDIRFLKLIDPGDGKGFERWIDGGAHTAYLYPVTGGAAELISLGKQIVDDDFLD
jgi:hypothetical protein